MDDEVQYISIGKTILLARRYLSPISFSVWAELVSYNWMDPNTNKFKNYVFPSIETISEFVGIGTSSVKKAIRELTILGFVASKTKRARNPDTYYLNYDPEINEEKIKELKEFQKGYSEKRKPKKL